MDYEIDPLRQSIGDSCPSSLDDSTARREWGWEPAYDLEATVEDMLKILARKFGLSD
jgi:nucleoside-diphosphate-sugar epimerase